MVINMYAAPGQEQPLRGQNLYKIPFFRFGHLLYIHIFNTFYHRNRPNVKAYDYGFDIQYMNILLHFPRLHNEYTFIGV